MATVDDCPRSAHSAAHLLCQSFDHMCFNWLEAHDRRNPQDSHEWKRDADAEMLSFLLGGVAGCACLGACHGLERERKVFFVSSALVGISCRRSQLPVRKTKAE